MVFSYVFINIWVLTEKTKLKIMIFMICSLVLLLLLFFTTITNDDEDDNDNYY